MPPAISDDEASDAGNGVSILSRREKKAVSYSEVKADIEEDEDEDEDEATNGDATNDAEAAEEEEEEGDDEAGGEEYVVEKILAHMIADDGKPRFKVKWEGFESKNDLTWEPEDNLRGTADAFLDDYLEMLGGYQELFNEANKALKTKKRGRSATGTPSSTTKRSRKNGDHPLDSEAPESLKAAAWKPPVGSWEDHIDNVDMTRDEHGDLIVWLSWKNGEKSQHKAQQAYTRAPQRMLKFYESKINFTGP